MSNKRAALLVAVAFLVVLVIGFGRNYGTPPLGVVESAGTVPSITEIAPEPTEPAYVPAPAGEGHVEYGTVDRVIDGDTLEVVQKGSERDVRVLGIDTPETKHPDKGVQCYGPQAAAETAKLLPKGAEVRLHFEGVEHEDRFGRLLAYVEYAPGLDLSSQLVGAGFARAYPLKHRYAVAKTPELLALQAKARSAKLGLWGACS